MMGIRFEPRTWGAGGWDTFPHAQPKLQACIRADINSRIAAGTPFEALRHQLLGAQEEDFTEGTATARVTYLPVQRSPSSAQTAIIRIMRMVHFVDLTASSEGPYEL